MVPVCVFAKPPIPGEVKTRLAIATGHAGAAGLAAAMLRDVWNAVSSCPQARAVLAAAVDGDFPIRVPPANRWLQGAGDLGARIERILRRGIEEGASAIAVGADSPLLTSACLTAAIAALETNEAVMGRCEDGGFYLLGLRECAPGLLADIAWSSAGTASAVADRIARRGGRVAELAISFDVDTPGDLARLAACLEKDAVRAPETHAFLRRNRTCW